MALDLHQKIYVAGHRGMVGSAIVRNLQAKGFTNIVTRTHAQLDLTNQAQVKAFFEQEKPNQVYLAAAKVGGTAPTVLNAANEIAVAAFLDEGMPYLQIPNVVEKTLSAIPVSNADSIESILEIDAQARTVARDFIKTFNS